MASTAFVIRKYPLLSLTLPMVTAFKSESVELLLMIFSDPPLAKVTLVAGNDEVVIALGLLFSNTNR